MQLKWPVEKIRRRLGFPYWSLSAWAKLKVKNAVNFIGDFEATLGAEAVRLGTDGVVCGHIHRPQLKVLEGVREFPMRVKCATLPWHTLVAALEDRTTTVTTEDAAPACPQPLGAAFEP